MKQTADWKRFDLYGKAHLSVEDPKFEADLVNVSFTFQMLARKKVIKRSRCMTIIGSRRRVAGSSPWCP